MKTITVSTPVDRRYFADMLAESNSGFVSRKWLLLPAMVAGFLLQHAVEGWCPPLVPLRRLGVRTRKEIEKERYALKVLRGDIGALDGNSAREVDQLWAGIEK